jgi:hypothetical protein
MRRRYNGFILQFTRSDHEGRHIHVYRDNRQLGVFDRLTGPIRGLEEWWSRDLQEAIERFIRDLHERGDWQ